jgi:hypothetical protein
MQMNEGRGHAAILTALFLVLSRTGPTLRWIVLPAVLLAFYSFRGFGFAPFPPNFRSVITLITGTGK